MIHMITENIELQPSPKSPKIGANSAPIAFINLKKTQIIIITTIIKIISIDVFSLLYIVIANFLYSIVSSIFFVVKG